VVLEGILLVVEGCGESYSLSPAHAQFCARPRRESRFPLFSGAGRL